MIKLLVHKFIGKWKCHDFSETVLASEYNQQVWNTYVTIPQRPIQATNNMNDR